MLPDATRPCECSKLPPQGCGQRPFAVAAHTVLRIQSSMTASLLASSVIRSTFFAALSGDDDRHPLNLCKSLNRLDFLCLCRKTVCAIFNYNFMLRCLFNKGKDHNLVIYRLYT